MSSEPNKAITTAEGTSLKPTALSFGHVSETGTAPRPAPAAASSELKVILGVGGMEPVERLFSPGDVLVGRRPSNDLVIDGEGLKVVSGFHLRFAYESGRWCVEDKNSTNGTYLNGVRTKGLQAVRDGDIIELGRPRTTGTYRAVKLTVGLTGAAAVQATADVPPPVTAVPSAPPTIVADHNGTTVKPAPVPGKKIPAVHPAGIRELIDRVQAKSRRLGEVSYRLEAYVADLASAAVERHVALDIAKVSGGSAVIDLIAREERLDATLISLESELPSVRARLADELAPLESIAAEEKEIFDVADAQFKSAAKRRDEGFAALKAAFTDAATALRSALAPVVDVIDEERAASLSSSPTASLDPATGEPVWKYWSVALQSGMEEINARQDELGAIRAEAADAAELAQRAEEKAKSAEAIWTTARMEADDRRIAIEASVTEKEKIFSEATAEIAVVRDSMDATAKEFILSVLSAPESASGSLGSLAGMQDARELFQEVEVLQRELAELESATF